MKTIGERLRYARNLKVWSQDALSDISGVKQGTISKLERGDSQTSTFIPQLAHALDCSPMWLAEGVGNPPELPPVSEPHRDFEHVDLPDGTALVTDTILVPQISWVQAGNFEEMVTPYGADIAEKWVRCPAEEYGSVTFALRNQGISMEPEFKDGDVVFVDPSKAQNVRSGSFVIVRMDDENTATLKQFFAEGEHKYLKALNPNWPTPIIEVNGAATIIGVVIAKMKSYS